MSFLHAPKKRFSLSITIILFVFNLSVNAENFTYRGAESLEDQRFDYDLQLLELALKKTIATHGDYNLISAPPMNNSRVTMAMSSQQYENYFALLSHSQKYQDELDFVPVPAQRGIVGYRIFLTNETVLMQLRNLKELSGLKDYTVVQGQGWLDVSILRHNQFKVRTLSNMETIFNFVAHNRANLFPRGVNEVFEEYHRLGPEIEQLRIEPDYALYYPFLRFFYTSKRNKKALKRLHQGLLAAWKDGSFMNLWKQYYMDNLLQANLNKRKILYLENPELDAIKGKYEQYIYKP